MSLGVWILVAVLGGLGAVLRFIVDWLVSLRLGFRFPFGILAVNLSGAFVLGLLAGASLGHNAYLFAGTALLGSYTTFSTWMLDTQQLAARGNNRAALLNVVLSVLIGFGVAALGQQIGMCL
jgi:fluoride exporter